MAPSPGPSTPDSAATAPQIQTQQPILKSFSCVLCAQRKVKCDRAIGGCANCTKARVDCIYRAPPPPRRRKKGAREIDVNARLRLYEEALRRVGVEPEEVVRRELDEKGKSSTRTEVIGVNYVGFTAGTGEGESVKEGDEEPGVLLSANGKSRYLENTLWTSLRGEFRDSGELLLGDTSSEDEEERCGFYNTPSPPHLSSDGANILLGATKTSSSLRYMHPMPAQMFKLWQAYLDNVNPLVKVLHTPTAQQIVSNASGNLDDLPKNVEALLFSIYCVAVESLSGDDCESIFGTPKNVLSTRFKTAAQHALLNANFLKSSSIMVLQAFFLFIASLEPTNDARVIWILTGVASRIGQRIGLHRDPSTLKLPPFESEIRRRLWWEMIMHDGFAEKLAGTGGNIFFGSVNLPANVNDSDLFPGMKEIPREHEGATEMMFFLIRCHFGEFLRNSVNIRTNFDGAWNKISTNAATLAAKDKAIDELEAVYDRKFLCYCDQSIPWHFMCSYLAKGAVNMLRFIAHNSEYENNNLSSLSQEARDTLFRTTVSVIEGQNLAYTMKEMKGFQWHVNGHFQWKALIYVVVELRQRTHGIEVDKAWKQVGLVFEHHGLFGRDTQWKALPVAIGRLTSRAWDCYVQARGVPAGGEPEFIRTLREKLARMAASPPSNPPCAQSEHIPPVPSAPTVYPQPQDFTSAPVLAFSATDPMPDESLQLGADFTAGLETAQALPPLDPDLMNWANWDDLLAGVNYDPANMGDMEGW